MVQQVVRASEAGNTDRLLGYVHDDAAVYTELKAAQEVLKGKEALRNALPVLMPAAAQRQTHVQERRVIGNKVVDDPARLWGHEAPGASRRHLCRRPSPSSRP